MAGAKHGRKQREAPDQSVQDIQDAGARQSLVVPEYVHHHICELYRNLRLTRCALLIAAQMLEARQSAGDAEVTRLLQEDIGPRLDAEIDRGEKLLAHINGTQAGISSARRKAGNGRP